MSTPENIPWMPPIAELERVEYIRREHAEMVKNLAKPGEKIQASLTPAKVVMLFRAIRIAVIAGEFLDQTKKAVIYNKDIDLTALFNSFKITIGNINPEEIMPQLDPSMCHAIHMAVGVASEGCELLSAFEDAIYEKRGLGLANILEELGDTEWFLEGLRQNLNMTRPMALAHNLNKLLKGEKARYKDGKYSDKAAIDRQDKQQETIHRIATELATETQVRKAAEEFEASKVAFDDKQLQSYNKAKEELATSKPRTLPPWAKDKNPHIQEEGRQFTGPDGTAHVHGD